MATDTTREVETTPAGTEAAGTEETTGTPAQPETGSTTTAAGSDAAAEGAADTSAADTSATDTSATDKGTEQDKGAEKTAATEVGSVQDAAAAATRPGALAGAGAVIGTALGFASLTGTSLTDMFRDRAQLMGQIEAATGTPGNQIEAFYGTPWHTAALVNGVVALLAVVVGVVVLLGPAAKATAPAWARPVALSGLVLGVIGLLVSGGMYLDLFAAQPVLPPMPSMPGMPG